MATAPIGKIQEFQPDSESWTSYVERIKLYFTANDIASAKRVPVFLSVIGAKHYELLRNLLAPTQPKDKSFDALVKTLKDHYEPKPISIAERFHFHRRVQAANESVAEYVAELRRMTVHCEYGAFLEEAIRDQFVWGLRSANIQSGIFSPWLICRSQKQCRLHKGWKQPIAARNPSRRLRQHCRS